MSYSIRLVKPEGYSGPVPVYTASDIPVGGTYCVGPGLPPLAFNITFNYYWYFKVTVDEAEGISWIAGKTGERVLYRLKNARPKLVELMEREKNEKVILAEVWNSPYDEERYGKDYWYTCAENALRALDGLIKLCNIAPGYVFEVWK